MNCDELLSRKDSAPTPGENHGYSYGLTLLNVLKQVKTRSGLRTILFSANLFHTESNGLPGDVVSSPTFASFRRRLKPFLFQQSCPDIVI